MRRIHLSAPAESQLPDSQIFCKILMYCTAGCLSQILYSQSKNSMACGQTMSCI